MADQMHSERGRNREGAQRCDQHAARGAVLDDANLGVQLRVQVIRKMLDRRVEQFCGNDGGAGERHERPPYGFGLEHKQCNDDSEQRDNLKAQTMFGLESGCDTRSREAQPRQKRLIFE